MYNFFARYVIFNQKKRCIMISFNLIWSIICFTRAKECPIISLSLEIIKHTCSAFSVVRFYLATRKGINSTISRGSFGTPTGNDARRNLDRFIVLPEYKHSFLVASRFQAERMAKLKLLSPLID